jgi:predicted amidohydrolase YtcJ
VLKTRRPIAVQSSFGHTYVVNTRALAIAKLDAATPDPPAGKIGRDAQRMSRPAFSTIRARLSW